MSTNCVDFLLISPMFKVQCPKPGWPDSPLRVWTLDFRLWTWDVAMPGQFEVMIERNFSSAHQLRGYKGKCENLHGHNYKIEIYARGSELNNIGLLVDFVELKEAADDLVTYLDHKNLNELEPFVVEQNPSAENVARFVLERLASKINDDRVQIYKVRCFETPTSVATYQVD